MITTKPTVKNAQQKNLRRNFIKIAQNSISGLGFDAWVLRMAINLQ